MAESIAYALTTYLGASASAATAWSYVIVAAATVAYGGYQQRKAKARARDAANASAKDREVMIRSAIAPRRYIYGTDRVSGPIVFMQSTGDKSQYLHLVIALAAHECDAVEKIWFNDVELPALDGSGFVTDGEFKSAESSAYGTYSGTTDGSGNIALPQAALSIEAAYTEIGYGEAATQTHYPDRTHTSGSATVGNLPAATAVTLSYTYAQAGSARVRVHVHLGGSGQTADADLISECGGNWTSAHIGADICYLAVRLEYDQDIFGSIGIPNISALVRGKKVYDPRTSTTAWSSNAALCVADFLKSAEGMRATGTEVPDAEIITAANICDEVIDLELGGATTQLRYTCDTSFTSERAPRDVLGELATCMAGRCVWTQGRWLVRAGAHRTPTLTITADMLAGPVSVVPRTSRSDLFNAVRATYRDPEQQYAEVQAPLVLNSGYEAEDGGVRIVRQIDIPTLADTYRAQRLAKIELERARQALSVRLTTTLRGYDLSPTDTVMLTLDLYGFDAKVFEVLERTIAPDGTLQYTLRETAAGVWDWNYGEATVGDLAPNTTLPSPFAAPAALTGLTASQSQTLLGDGTIVAQATLTWNPSQDAFVIGGGRIDVQWSRAEPIAIISTSQAGTTIGAVLAPLVSGIAYIARVRQVNAVGRLGPWSYASFVAGADTVPPEDVQNLDWEIKPGLVKITCDPCIAADYAATELRVLATVPDYDSGDWGAAIFLVRGASNEYHHPRPPNGTYYVLAKHMDTSGNYSVNPAYITVVVDDSIDTYGGTGTLRLSTNRFPVFIFPTGTSHTSTDPDLIITAKLFNLVGAAVWTAEAFDVSEVSLGNVTLTGSGNERTMTAAAFVAPGTAGSVRTVQVTATVGPATDTLTVYRLDPTITEARLYLSNPYASVPTDAAGEFGDYSDAVTSVVVYVGATEDTDNWSIAITADAGVTATINGGAGPVTGTLAVTVAVTNMTVPDGAVLVTATQGMDVLEKTFRIEKNEARGSGYTAYFEPRTEIVLPALSDGTVASYADAWSNFHIVQGGALDVTDQWTLSKSDLNVISTLTDNRVDVTALLGLGSIGTAVVTPQSPMPSGWVQPVQLIYGGSGGGGSWVCIGFGSTTKVLTSDDGINWTERDTGVSAGRFENGGYIAGRFVLVAGPANPHARVLTSTDKGVTWTEGTLPSSGAWSVCTVAAGKLFLAAGGTTCLTTTNGTSWSTYTAPNGYCGFAAVGNTWVACSQSSALLYISTNAGGSWTAVSPATYGAPAGSQVSRVLAFQGRIVVPVHHNSFTTTAMLVWENGVWSLATTPVAYSIASYNLFAVIAGVLYLVASGGLLLYSTDGVAWGHAGATVAPDVRAPHTGPEYLQMHGEFSGNFIPTLTLATPKQYVRIPLVSISDSVGGVTVRAQKSGQLDITAFLPVRKGAARPDLYLSYANPGILVLPATSDGYVISFDNAVVTAGIDRNGVADTANWTWTYTTTHLTPSSGSSNVVTVTDMDPAEDVGYIDFTASKAGQRNITGQIEVRKIKGSDPSGPRYGAVYNVIDTQNTYLAVRFQTNGIFQIKRGSGGSYVDAGFWALPVSSAHSAYWLQVIATGHALTSGTTGAWLAMTSAREYVLSDASTGTHRTDLQVMFATDNTGSNAGVAFGALVLIVP